MIQTSLPPCTGMNHTRNWCDPVPRDRRNRNPVWSKPPKQLVRISFFEDGDDTQWDWYFRFRQGELPGVTD